MAKIVWLVLLASSLIFGCGRFSSENYGDDLLIRHVQIVSPGDDAMEAPTDVLIRNSRIHAIGESAIAQTGKDVESLDGTGLFLSPGLIDGHTHLNEIPGMTFDHERAYPEVAAEARRQIPLSYLYHGFTTVVDLNATPVTIDKWNSKAPRPQAYFCGAAPVFDGYPMSFMPKPERYEWMPYFLFDESRAREFPDGFDPLDHSPAAVVSEIHRDGGICVKTHYESGFGGRGDLPVPTQELIVDLVTEAHNAGMPVLMHANSESAQAFGVASGVDAFAHGMWTWNDRTSTVPSADIIALVDATIRAGIALQPTIQVLYGEQDIHNPDYLTDKRLKHVIPQSLIGWYGTDDGQWWRRRMLNIPIVAQLVADGRWNELDAPPIARVSSVLEYYAQRDGKLIFGSDTPSDPTFANPPGLNGRIEMDRWIAAGVSPVQLFHAATNGNAEFFGLSDDLGTVEVGKRADLLLTRKNPTDSVSAYDSIEFVIIAGKPIERSSLSAITGSEH